MSVSKYRILCTTDSKQETVWGTAAPTVCPANAGHSVDLDSVAIVDSVSPVVRVTEIDSLLSDTAPTVNTSGLVITTDVGNLIVSDQYTVTPDNVDTKYTKVSLCFDNTDESISVYIYTKTTGVYGATPSNKTTYDIKEYSTPANGTALTDTGAF